MVHGVSFLKQATVTAQETGIPGDGIGPEVVKATMAMAEAAGADIEWDRAQAGASVSCTG